MLFHSFKTQEERREYGGSGFIEFQFCRLPVDTTIGTLVSVGSIKFWQDDSLYVANENIFYERYSHFFHCGVYNNLKSGPVDVYGINYYSPHLTEGIIKNICEEQPADYEILVDWLKRAKLYNGFYILGI